MGQSSTTCENDEQHLGMLDDEYEPQTNKKRGGSTKGRKELTTQTKIASSDEQKPMQVINERIKWPNENKWRERLIDSAYKVSKNRTNTKIDQLFATLPTELIASSICQFLDIRSVLYLMRGTNRKIYMDLQNNLTHFYFVPMLIDEDGDSELDDSYFPEDHKKPKQTEEKPKIIFPPKHAFSWYWEPILALFPKLTIIQIPQMHILTQHFDVKADLSPLTSLKLINNRCLEHRFLQRFPQYNKIIVTNDDKDAFSANPRFIDSYRNINTLQLSCVKNIDNETMNRFLSNFPNLKSLYISTCQFTNANFTPPTRKGDFIKDPNCIIDFSGLSTPYLEELTVLCIESMYDVSSLIEKSSKLKRFRFSSNSNVLSADKLESLCVTRQNQFSL